MVGSNISFSHPVGASTTTGSALAKGMTGLLVAVSIIGLWAASLMILLHLNITELPGWLLPILLLWQMFLYTGLFATAHDAMHGSVCPQNSRLNHFIGTVTVFCYATFLYRELLSNHRLHHRHPASEQDPDFHDGEHKHPASWYFHFMKQYWGWRQFTILSIIFQLAYHFLHIPASNLFLFWVTPPILSSIQLFYFGTFLTHRESEAGYTNPHRARTTSFSTFWSFITCYHFGYHQEHHEYPHLAWWQLPAARHIDVYPSRGNQ